MTRDAIRTAIVSTGLRRRGLGPDPRRRGVPREHLHHQLLSASRAPRRSRTETSSSSGRAYGQDGPNGFGVFGQRFAASGAQRGSEFRINAFTTQLPLVRPSPLEASGDFIVVLGAATDRTVRAMSLHGQRFDCRGQSPSEASSSVNTFTWAVSTGRMSAGPPDGRFVVTWASLGIDGSFSGIAARRFDASGNVLGDRVRREHVHVRRPEVRRRRASRPTATSSSSG